MHDFDLALMACVADIKGEVVSKARHLWAKSALLLIAVVSRIAPASFLPSLLVLRVKVMQRNCNGMLMLSMKLPACSLCSPSLCRSDLQLPMPLLLAGLSLHSAAWAWMSALFAMPDTMLHRECRQTSPGATPAQRRRVGDTWLEYNFREQ